MSPRKKMHGGHAPDPPTPEEMVEIYHETPELVTTRGTGAKGALHTRILQAEDEKPDCCAEFERYHANWRTWDTECWPLNWISDGNKTICTYCVQEWRERNAD